MGFLNAVLTLVFFNQCLWSLVFIVAWEGEELQQAFGGALRSYLSPVISHLCSTAWFGGKIVRSSIQLQSSLLSRFRWYVPNSFFFSLASCH